MSQAKRNRRALQWMRYTGRYITPERGGMSNVALPVGSVKALFTAERRKYKTYISPWSWSDAYWTRESRS